ncbi:MAG: fumarylacetoacetate hydrolase family protein, partial [Longimicrobiales bacterium]|nr:fumarylacetoacetate hydrolase family protein [Longimicrobiales bacterium]
PVNDITARDLQQIDDQWARAKGFDTFCAVGTPVPLADVVRSTLGVITRVNGEVRQEGDAADMVFDIPTILEYITSFMTLEPGDLVATGTPEGVAPLNDGDVVEIEVIGVGSVKNPVVQGG